MIEEILKMLEKMNERIVALENQSPIKTEVEFQKDLEYVRGLRVEFSDALDEQLKRIKHD